MAEDIKTKIKKYRTAPFDSRFPNQNQTRNCWQNYLGFHCCEKAMPAKGGDVSVCEWYWRVFKSLCPISWVLAWDDCQEEGPFRGKIMAAFERQPQGMQDMDQRLEQTLYKQHKSCKFCRSGCKKTSVDSLLCIPTVLQQSEW